MTPPCCPHSRIMVALLMSLNELPRELQYEVRPELLGPYLVRVRVH